MISQQKQSQVLNLEATACFFCLFFFVCSDGTGISVKVFFTQLVDDKVQTGRSCLRS